MNHVSVGRGVNIAYESEWFGPPWEEPEVALLVHGAGESSRSWIQWVPLLSQKLRVIRPDLPGFGSSIAPESYGWTAREYAGDLVRLLDDLEIASVHLIGAKYGGTVAMQLAGEWPERVRSLSVISSPVGLLSSNNVDVIRKHGHRAWVAKSQRGRLGSAAPEAQIRWWTDELMGIADERSVLGCLNAVQSNTIIDMLPLISAPTVVVTTERSKLQSLDVARGYQEMIPNSRLAILPGDSYHPAAVQVDQCAAIVLELVKSVQGKSPPA